MANKAHVDLLMEGPGRWNEWREANPQIVPDLSGANLTKLRDFHQTNLVGANLTAVNFGGSIFSRSNFRDSNLKNANFEGSKLARANFLKVDLQGVNFEGAVLANASLRQADLRGANLSRALLIGADLGGARLTGANLSRTIFPKRSVSETDFTETNLSEADLSGIDLSGKNFRSANLIGANLSGANLARTTFAYADLGGAILNNTQLIETDFRGANLTNCSIHGIAAWRLTLDEAKQSNLTITSHEEPTITVDNVEVAQFIYLLINNKKIREVIDAITSKVVLILGRFTAERKVVLDAIRNALRERGYLPILFDFDKPSSRDITETISILAHIARFVIADITEARSIPQELEHIIPALPSVPVQPLLEAGADEYGMFEHFPRYPWVLPTYRYENKEDLIISLPTRVLVHVEAKVKELRQRR